MGCKSIWRIATVVFFAVQVTAFADTPTRIQVRVVDEKGEPVKGASVRARYLATISQDGKDYRVPMELAAPQTSDSNGRCDLALHDVSWTLAGLYAHRVDLTSDEVVELYENVPADPRERDAFEREVADRSAQFSVAYQVLVPETDDAALITLEMAPAIKITGRIHVNGQPLAKAFVTIYSRETPIDQLFARSAPELTDREGRFSYYSVRGDLNLARIVVERASGNWVLYLRDVRSKATSAGREFELDTEKRNYALVKRKEQ